MASLNLVPNPPVLITQLIIFISNLFIIKKFFIQPYLELKKLRDASTKGKHEESLSISNRSKEIADEIEKKIFSTQSEALQIIKTKVNEGKSAREKISEEFKSKSESLIKEKSKVIDEEFKSAQREIESSIGKLTEEIYKKVLEI